MEILFVIILVLVLLTVIWPFIVLVLAVVVLSLMVFGAGGCIIFLSLYAISIFKTVYLRASGNLGRVIEVAFDRNKLSWFIDKELIIGFANSPMMLFVSCTIAFASMVALLSMMKNAGWFQIDVLEEIELSEVSILYPVSILSGIAFIILIAASYDKCTDIFEGWMLGQGNRLMSRVEKRVSGIESLLSLESSINAVSNEIGADFPIDTETAIQSFLCSHKMEILNDVAGFNKFISKRIEEAEYDLSELEKANDLYQAAMNLYDETIHKVNKTGSIPLIKELEYDYEGLASTNLRTLVTNRKWNKFSEVVNAIVADLKRLSELAVRYQEEGYQAEIENFEGETNEDRAYRILGVPSTASPKEIKDVYYALSQVYHEDKKIVQDDTRMKEITWAYHLLKELKNIK